MKNKILIIRLIISLILFIISYFVNNIACLILCIIAFVICSYDIFIKAIKNIFSLDFFDENFLMILASITALTIGYYEEGVLVILLYQVGELFQKNAVNKSRTLVKKLIDIMPKEANKVIDNNIIKINASTIKKDDIIEVLPNMQIPVDGIVIKGDSLCDLKSLTGESKEEIISIGSNVYQSSINISNLIHIKALKDYKDSESYKISIMLKKASENKTKINTFIKRFSKIYTPFVVILATIITFILPLFFKYTYKESLYKAATFLVTSCPCALLISVPLSFFCSIGNLSKKGILVKGSNHIEDIVKCRSFVFDKTGTLTKGEFSVSDVFMLDKTDILYYASMLESYSVHPIAYAICSYYNKKVNKELVKDFKNVLGTGLFGYINGNEVFVGNRRIFDYYNLEYKYTDVYKSVVYVFVNKKLRGYITLVDKEKDNALLLISKLKKCNKDVYLLSGDNKEVVSSVAKNLGIDNYKYKMLPQDKLDFVSKLENNKNHVCFSGDGINDALVIQKSKVGISMGSIGSDISILEADVIINDDDIYKVYTFYKESKRCMNIIKFNIIFIILVKFLVLFLSMFISLNIIFGILADVGVCIFAVINSSRLLR